ncbi:MAG: hypothetical protein K2O85_09280 [Helicobacter sp.]|nr:hypothetical protein [Helicobacter sp.]
MISTLQVQYTNSNRQSWSVNYDSSKTTGNVQNFQDKLVRNQKEYKDNAQNIHELVSIMKDNVQANFENCAINAWKLFEYYAENPIPTTIDEHLSNMAHITWVSDSFAYSKDYKDGVSYLTNSIQDRQWGLSGNERLNSISLDTMEWDAIGANSLVDSELKNRGFKSGVSESTYQESMNILTKLLDKVLSEEYAKDSKSSLTNALLVLRAELELSPEKWEKIQQQAAESAQETLTDALNPNANLEEIDRKLKQINDALSRSVGIGVLVPIERIAALLSEHLSPDEQQEMFDALNHVRSYIHENASNVVALLSDSEMQLKMQNMAFYNNLISRFSAIDNTEILLNLASDSNLQANAKESKSYESLIDRIRSKLKGNDDSILQQVMSKITNGVKTAGASGIGEGV